MTSLLRRLGLGLITRVGHYVISTKGQREMLPWAEAMANVDSDVTASGRSGRAAP